MTNITIAILYNHSNNKKTGLNTSSYSNFEYGLKPVLLLLNFKVGVIELCWVVYLSQRLLE